MGIPLSAQTTALLLQLFNGDINPNYFLFLWRWGGIIKGGDKDHAQSSKAVTSPTPPARLLKAKPSRLLTDLPCWGHRQQHPGSPALAAPFRRRKGSPESSKKPDPPGGGQPVASSLHGPAPKWRTALQVAAGGQPRHRDHGQGYGRSSADPARTAPQTGAQIQSHNAQVPLQTLHTSLSWVHHHTGHQSRTGEGGNPLSFGKT